MALSQLLLEPTWHYVDKFQECLLAYAENYFGKNVVNDLTICNSYRVNTIKTCNFCCGLYCLGLLKYE